MATRQSKNGRAVARILKLQESARARYVYFICVSDDPDEPGYWWELVDADGALICESSLRATKAECFKLLRTTQRHASSAPIRDDAR